MGMDGQEKLCALTCLRENTLPTTAKSKDVLGVKRYHFRELSGNLTLSMDFLYACSLVAILMASGSPVQKHLSSSLWSRTELRTVTRNRRNKCRQCLLANELLWEKDVCENSQVKALSVGWPL